MYRFRLWVSILAVGAVLAGLGAILWPAGRSSLAATAATRAKDPSHGGENHPKSAPPAAGSSNLSNPATWKPATAAQRKSAMNSITHQLEAFGRGDYAAAAIYQSSGLKNHFPSVDAFKQMMESAYPQFAHYRSVQFGPAISDPTGQHLLIQANVTGKDVVTVKAAYLMVLEGKVFKVESVFGGNAPPAPPAINV